MSHTNSLYVIKKDKKTDNLAFINNYIFHDTHTDIHTDGHGDSMTKPGQRPESVKILNLNNVNLANNQIVIIKPLINSLHIKVAFDLLTLYVQIEVK